MKVEITREDKILFPKDKFTKGDLITYYQAVASRMLPLIKDRPISMKRYPNGIKKEGFIQKKVSDYFPSWIKTKSVARKGQSKINMLICNDKSTLTYLANQACITPHIWLSKKEALEKPNRIVFDLDPPGKNFAKVIEAARDLREILEKDLKLKCYVMTTGSKGLHIVIPIKKEYSFEETRAFAKKVGQLLCLEKPSKYTVNPRKSGRRSKVFIDYLRNGYAQTGVAPYALRALDGAPIATPLSWREVTSKLSPQSFHIKNIKRRFSKPCPWRGLDGKGFSLKSAIKKLDRLLIHLTHSQ